VGNGYKMFSTCPLVLIDKQLSLLVKWRETKYALELVGEKIALVSEEYIVIVR